MRIVCERNMQGSFLYPTSDPIKFYSPDGLALKRVPGGHTPLLDERSLQGVLFRDGWVANKKAPVGYPLANDDDIKLALNTLSDESARKARQITPVSVSP